MRKTLAVIVSIMLVGALGTMSAMAGAAMEAKFGHIAPPFHGQSKGCDAFADYVKQKTNGAVSIKTFPFGQLGSETSMVEQVQTGTLQMASITAAVLQNYVPQVAVTDLPFLFPDRKTAYAVLDDPKVQEKIFSHLPAKGLVGIGWTENEFRDITNTERDVRKPEDMKGLKIRVMKSPIYMDTFKALGASPVDLAFPQIYSALQNGTIDAQENPLLTSVLIKATEITKHVTKTGHILTECIIIVNPDFWKKLTPDQQKIFREAAKVAIKTNREVNAELMNKLPKTGESVADYCKKNNVTVIDLTPAEREQFKKAMTTVWDKYRAKIGPELFQLVTSKVDEYSKKK
jgi:TRAP-type transport system periplasmic protein